MQCMDEWFLILDRALIQIRKYREVESNQVTTERSVFARGWLVINMAGAESLVRTELVKLLEVTQRSGRYG